MDRKSWILLAGFGLAACGGGSDGETPATVGSRGPGGGDAAPDLVVDALSVAPAEVETGASLSVQDAVCNAGTASASPSQLAIHLSVDDVLDASDLLLGTRGVGALASGASSSARGSLTVPTSTPPGDYRLLAVADAESGVDEADETNNLRVATGTVRVVLGTLPNVVPAQLAVAEATVEAGQELTVSESVRNDGEAEAGTFQVGVYLSVDATITPGDRLLGLRSVESLAPGELSFGADALLVPADTPAGDYRVGLLADVGGMLAESDEFDNALLAASPVAVTRPPRPDLAPISVVVDATAIEAGQGLTVDDEVVNQGSAEAGSFLVAVWLSADDVLDGDDVLLGERSVSGLSVGGSSTGSGSYLVPADTGAGARRVGLVVDPGTDVTEEDETNNVLLAAGSVEVSIPPLPDLRPTALSVSPSVLEAGGTITAIERVVNEGTAPAGAFRIGVYLSSNPVIAPTDHLIGSRVVDGLGTGDANEAQSEYPLPVDVASGSWYVGVIADDLGEQLELQEGDGALLSPNLIDVTAAPDPHPDLVVEALSTPADRVSPGGSLLVLSTVRNEGDLSAPAFQVGIYLSADDEITTGDVLIGERTVFSLGVGFGSAQSFPYTVPTDVAVGDWYLGAIADHGQVVAESDEDDNVRVASGTVEVWVPPPPAPNLVVSSLDASLAGVGPGSELVVLDVVANQGDLVAGSTRVVFRLVPEDAEGEEAAVPLGARTVASLGAGAESSASTTLQVPVDLAPGTWILSAVVDDLNGVAESNEEDNEMRFETLLEVP